MEKLSIQDGELSRVLVPWNQLKRVKKYLHIMVTRKKDSLQIILGIMMPIEGLKKSFKKDNVIQEYALKLGLLNKIDIFILYLLLIKLTTQSAIRIKLLVGLFFFVQAKIG